MRITPEDPRFWKPKEAAAYIQVSLQTLYSYCGTHEHWKRRKKAAKPIGPPPPFRRFGRNVIRFPIREFKEWAEPKKGL